MKVSLLDNSKFLLKKKKQKCYLQGEMQGDKNVEAQ